ncbi:hypothetical protein N7528_003329 [Penicillium herquei]|nr:hypothetical protein N7528_003329 [Penicillium herquei]
MPERTDDSYLNCFLCLHHVDRSRLDSYHIYPVSHQTNHMECRTPLGQMPSQYEDTIPPLESPRTWVLHTRCRHLVGNLSQGMVGSLVDLVEPTFLDICSHPRPTSLNGGFYYAPPQLPTDKESSTHVEFQPENALTLSLLHKRWPPEIWHMIQQHDIGRLIFIMRIAAQLEKSGLRPAFMPESRFIITTLSLTSCVIRIHLATLGGCTYISRLSDPMAIAAPPLSPPYTWNPPSLPNKLVTQIKENLKIRYRDFIISDCTYLATKSDGMGIVDIAFRCVNKRPHWILNMTTQAFVPELSEIRDADIQNLTVISDVWLSPR